MPGRQTAGPAELQRQSARAHRRKRVWHMTSDLVLPDNKERSIAAWDSVQRGAMDKPSGADSRDGLRHRELGLVPKHDACGLGTVSGLGPPAFVFRVCRSDGGLRQLSWLEEDLTLGAGQMALAAIAALSGGLVADVVPSCISTPGMRSKSSAAHPVAGGLCLSERPVWFRSMAACGCPTVDPSHLLDVVVHPCRLRSGFPGSVGERVSSRRRLGLSFFGFSSGSGPYPLAQAGMTTSFCPWLKARGCSVRIRRVGCIRSEAPVVLGGRDSAA